MSAKLLDGKTRSTELKEEAARRTAILKEKGITPGLAVVLVGHDPASEIYVRNKNRACENAGMHSVAVYLDENISQETLEEELHQLSADPKIHGILLQLPLPKQLDADRAMACIPPDKDVDGFSNENAGRLMNGQEGIRSCTPKGIMDLIAMSGVSLEGKHAVVVGRSSIVGKPVAMMLLEKNCTVTICHSKTPDLAAFTRQADILVAATGRAHLIQGDMVKPGAVVIDAGIARVDGKVTGDIEHESVSKVAGYLSPVPGGAGPMTIAELLMNTVEAAERSLHEV
ncbi:MAG: bifunctional methylenetetrahydrofolate dehydrogenase/methenyltetrahydrofolate cyclohydrolase FolD [Clostridia bacterium]|nr:bifunctional methylenetetrahydrofolate dehydrogenase/methenyltetrahydrofolate cyclohydrolase FolD [Clostridia bacterium]